MPYTDLYEPRRLFLQEQAGRGAEAVAQMSNEQVDSALAELYSRLNPREAGVIKQRYGLEDGRYHTLAETSKTFKVTKERVRQIEVRVFIAMQNPNQPRLSVRERRKLEKLADSGSE